MPELRTEGFDFEHEHQAEVFHRFLTGKRGFIYTEPRKDRGYWTVEVATYYGDMQEVRQVAQFFLDNVGSQPEEVSA